MLNREPGDSQKQAFAPDSSDLEEPQENFWYEGGWDDFADQNNGWDGVGESSVTLWQTYLAKGWLHDSSSRLMRRLSSKRVPQREPTEPTVEIVTQSASPHVPVEVAKPAPKRPPPKARKLPLETRFMIWYTMYRRLFTLVMTFNITLLCIGFTRRKDIGKHAMDISALNVVLSVLFRSEGFLRVLFFCTVRIFNPKWTPRSVAVFATDILHHLGGIHSGAAFASVMWLFAALLDSYLSNDEEPLAVQIIAWILLGLLILIILGALPVVRRLYHNSFEISHRFLGWTSLGLLWVLVILHVIYSKEIEGKDRGSYTLDGRRLISSASFWSITVITLIIIFPWLSVRRLKVKTIVSPAKDNVVMRFEGGITAGLFVRLARQPLLEWHTFAAVGMEGGAKADHHLVIASALGDFTRGLVQDPPSHIWVRTVRFAGVPYCLRMFNRATAVCTGAGIAPMLSSMLQKTCEINLVWVARTIDESFTPEVANLVMKCSHVRLWDTKKEGRPNLVELTATAVEEFGSEVVIITSNPSGTKRLLEGLHLKGIPAFGPTWDS